jgi:guanylate kinase
LEKRLRYRSTETEDKIQQRLRKAGQELSRANEFDVILVNEDLEVAIEQAKSLVTSFLGR